MNSLPMLIDEIVFKRILLNELEDSDFLKKLENNLAQILLNAYEDFYGLEYHKERLFNYCSTLYLAYHYENIVGFSYVKLNNRRGTTAIFPIPYRGMGIAESLIRLSLLDFPTQYAIVSNKQSALINLLLKCNFKIATLESQLRYFTDEEFDQLCDIKESESKLTFSRFSKRRNQLRCDLILLYA